MSDEDAIRRQLTRWMQLDDAYEDDRWIDDILDDRFVFHVGEQVIEGKAAVRELNVRRAEGPPRGKHIISEPCIELRGAAEATATTDYLYVTGSAAGGYSIAAAGQYRDELARDASGTWRVRSRTNTHLHVSPGA